MNKLQSISCGWVMVIGLMTTATGQSGVRNGDNKRTKVNDGSQVMVDKDEFSGATTIKLKPQKLIDRLEHQLTMSAEAKLGGTAPQTGLPDADERMLLGFTSLTSHKLDFGDQELHFLVDGKQVRGGSTAGGYNPRLPGEQLPSPYKTRHSFTGGLSLSQLKQIASGRKVEMRLGSIETTLNSELLSRLSEFVRNFQQAKGIVQP